MELDARRLLFPGIIAQDSGFFSFSLQDLRATLEAPEALVPEPGTLGRSCCASTISWGVLDVLHALGLFAEGCWSLKNIQSS